MKIDLSKSNAKSYPNKLEQHYSELLIESEKREKADLKYKYDPELDILKLEGEGEFKLLIKKAKETFSKDIEDIEGLNRYLYNSQSTIVLENDCDKAFIGGTEVDLDKLIIDKRGNTGQYGMEIIPPPFREDDKIEWTLSYSNERKKKVILNRVANKKSAYTKKYQFQDNCLKISLLLNENDISITMTNNNESKSKVTVAEIIESYLIQFAFLEKRLLINDVNITKQKHEFNKSTKELIYIVKHKINFWKKVQQLEDILSIEFKILLPISNEENVLLDKLIVSLLFKESYRELYNIKNITLNFPNESELKKTANNFKEERNIAQFAWVEKTEIQIFQNVINLKHLLKASNIEIKEIKEDIDNLEIKIFIKEKDKLGMIISSRLLQSKDEEEIVDMSKKALYLNEYWDRIHS